MHNLLLPLRKRGFTSLRAFVLLLVVLTLVSSGFGTQPVTAQNGVLTRRVNVPYLGAGPPADEFTPAIFWFGEVTPTNNYADVRVYYFDSYLKVVVHIIDRLIWYERPVSIENLADWDAVSLYLSLDGNAGAVPNENSYRFISQVNAFEEDSEWQTAYRGNGTGWSPEPVAFTTASTWRGQGLNNEDWDSGWQTSFEIPFTSVGFSSKPPDRTTWGLAMVVHDRDDAVGSVIPDQVWPELMDPNAPATWGELVFGLPHYQPPAASSQSVITIRQGLNGASVVDGHVGGHTTCSRDLWEGGIFTTFGTANYAGYGQINIQNQWDISDFACFSKYFVTFPLDALPPNSKILSATLTMHQFGNAWGELIEPSWIQVLTVGEDWDENTLTWNNAPLAVENISGTWVPPMSASLEWPGVPHHWDVSHAVAKSYAAGSPLRLALYSGDGAYHSGRYFTSSDTGDWNAEGRPTLRVTIGDSSVPPQPSYHIFTYLPQVLNSNK